MPRPAGRAAGGVARSSTRATSASVHPPPHTRARARILPAPSANPWVLRHPSTRLITAFLKGREGPVPIEGGTADHCRHPDLGGGHLLRSEGTPVGGRGGQLVGRGPTPLPPVPKPVPQPHPRDCEPLRFLQTCASGGGRSGMVSGSVAVLGVSGSASSADCTPGTVSVPARLVVNVTLGGAGLVYSC